MAVNKDDAHLLRILNQNKEKNFVKRILDRDAFPTLDLGNGNFATHKMAWGSGTDSKGKEHFYVHPTVLMTENRELKEFDGPTAWKHVEKTKNFIEFKTAEEADWFSKNYKRVWEIQDQQKTKRRQK